MEPIYLSDRTFEVWRYTVSHHQLLLRSNKEDRWETRLEVLFKDVALIAVPAVFQGMTIAEWDPEHAGLPADLSNLIGKKPLYRIASENSVGYIAAGAVFFHEDKLEYGEPSELLIGPIL